MKRLILTVIFLLACVFTLIVPAHVQAAPAMHVQQARYTIKLISSVHAIEKRAAYICDSSCNDEVPPSSCSQGAQTVISGYIIDSLSGSTWGLIEMRWSPACGTNWTRITSYENSQQLYAYIEHPAGRDGGSVIYQYGANTTQLWTPMVYSPNDPVKSYGNITIGRQNGTCVHNTGLSC